MKIGKPVRDSVWDSPKNQIWEGKMSKQNNKLLKMAAVFDAFCASSIIFALFLVVPRQYIFLLPLGMMATVFVYYKLYLKLVKVLSQSDDI